MHSLTSIAKTAKNPSHNTQRGIALFMVVVLLTTLLVLWSARSALFNEIITGDDVDYQRTFEAAQTMMRDAELDFMGEGTTGKPCIGSFCRPAALPGNINITGGVVYFPRCLAASYGQFTGAKAEAEGNPRLNEGTAWYWVEPMHYVSGPFSQPSQIFSPNGFAASNAPGFVFLITAIAEGRKQGTRVVLQRVFVRQTNTL